MNITLYRVLTRKTRKVIDIIYDVGTDTYSVDCTHWREQEYSSSLNIYEYINIPL